MKKVIFYFILVHFFLISGITTGILTERYILQQPSAHTENNGMTAMEPETAWLLFNGD